MYKSPFLQSIYAFMLAQHYSKHTISTYIIWIKAFIQFNGNRHPDQMGEPEIIRFLNHLAVHRKVSPSTQSTALNAIAFLYNKFLKIPLGEMAEFKRARRQGKRYFLTVSKPFWYMHLAKVSGDIAFKYHSTDRIHYRISHKVLPINCNNST